jgi:hypothetical protein
VTTKGRLAANGPTWSATDRAAKAGNSADDTITKRLMPTSSGYRASACTEPAHWSNWELDAVGSPAMKPPALTVRSLSCWIANCSVDATVPDEALNTSRDLAAALLASEPAAANEITMPRITNSAAVASQSGRRFEAASAVRRGSRGSPDDLPDP